MMQSFVETPKQVRPAPMHDTRQQRVARCGMSERRFVLVDFTHMNRAGCLRLYEAGRAYVLPRAIESTSRVPRVTTSPVGAPFRSISVFVTSVVPCTTSVTAGVS